MCPNLDIQNKKTIKKNEEETVIPRIMHSFLDLHVLF
jgi:hypothetical protein